MAGELPKRPMDGNGADDGEGKDRAERRAGPESMEASARLAAIVATIHEKRRKSAEGLGLTREDVDLLGQRFDWDMKAFVESKRARGEKLPEALESFGLSEGASRSASSYVADLQNSASENRVAERSDALGEDENPARRAAVVNREVQIGRRVADFLDANELAGGHTLDRHVGREVDYLVSRAMSQSRGKASAFYDRNRAEAAISHALSDPTWSKAIDSWLAGKTRNKERLVISADVTEPAGLVAFKNGETHASSRLRALLIRTDHGFRIHTAYLN